MKKLFFGLVVLMAICSCENREISQENEETISKEKLTIGNETKRDSIPGPGSDTGIGPVVTIPPR